MRLFYAIEFDDKTKDILVEIRNLLKKKAVKGNFTRKENLHLTLRFMGEVPDPNIYVLKKIQDLVSQKHSPFQLEISQIGFFSRGHNSIVWAGIKENKNLLQLQEDLENEIAANGFTPENRPYKPHITLAREFASNDDINRIIKEIEPLKHEFSVNSISLMESTRINGKLMYLCRYKTAICKNDGKVVLNE